ncbi:MAG: RICIN domain-containing protein [Pseudobacteriovorax sp.]|nr:RICIN domain-containing protein [Pseudobacteriovorax sp.]
MKLLTILLMVAISSSLSCRETRDPVPEDDNPYAKPVAGPELEPVNESPNPNSRNLEALKPDEEVLDDLGTTKEDAEQGKQEAETLIEEEEKVSPPKVFALKFKHSSMCLGVLGGSLANQANIHQLACNNSNSQRFHLIPSASEGYFFIRNINSNLCVTLSELNRNDGTNIFQFDCINSDSQKFATLAQENGFATIKNLYSQKCLDNTTNIFNPNNVIQWECHGDDNQLIQLQEIP